MAWTISPGQSGFNLNETCVHSSFYENFWTACQGRIITVRRLPVEIYSAETFLTFLFTEIELQIDLSIQNTSATWLPFPFRQKGSVFMSKMKNFFKFERTGFYEVLLMHWFRFLFTNRYLELSSWFVRDSFIFILKRVFKLSQYLSWKKAIIWHLIKLKVFKKRLQEDTILLICFHPASLMKLLPNVLLSKR